jgi:hypothetical protein
MHTAYIYVLCTFLFCKSASFNAGTRKFKLFLCLIKYHAMIAHGFVKVHLHTFLNLTPDGGE